MNILFLAPRLPFPADTGGKIRTINILKQVAKFAHVHLVCFSFDDKDRQYKSEIERLGIAVTLVPKKETPNIQKAFNVLLDSQPHSIVKYHSRSMIRAIRKLKKSQRFDAVHIDHLHMAHYLSLFKGLPCFLDEHNVEYKILERCAKVEPSLFKKPLLVNQASKMKRFEAKKIKQCAGFFAVSEDDLNLLKELTPQSSKGHVIPNGVDTEFFHPLENKNPEDILVFTGSMDWLPNDDAVLYFCREILPLIWKKNSQVKFYIVGKSPSAAAQELARKEARIMVTGRVDDVRPFMAKSKVFVVPIRVGGGTRLKILEAMSMQQGIVSTTIGAEGIRHTDGTDILLADTPKEFAQKVLMLLEDGSYRKSMAQSGRHLVCQTYDWNIIGKDLKRIYSEVGRG
jgi:sugar transferase (PEP-CTERM/EpsH1 system associated)